MRYLYDRIGQITQMEEVRFTVRCSYCEIYNEQVFDLLHLNSGVLNVRWNIVKGFFVQVRVHTHRFMPLKTHACPLPGLIFGRMRAAG